MSNVTRAVRLLSTLHASRTNIQSGKFTVDEVAKSTVFSPQHFPKFLSMSLVLSGYAGWTLMDTIRDRRGLSSSNRRERNLYKSSYPNIQYEEIPVSLDPRYRQ